MNYRDHELPLAQLPSPQYPNSPLTEDDQLPGFMSTLVRQLPAKQLMFQSLLKVSSNILPNYWLLDYEKGTINALKEVFGNNYSMSVIWASLVRSGLLIHVGSWVVLQYFGGSARLVSQYFGKSALR